MHSTVLAMSSTSEPNMTASSTDHSSWSLMLLFDPHSAPSPPSVPNEREREQRLLHIYSTVYLGQIYRLRLYRPDDV